MIRVKFVDVYFTPYSDPLFPVQTIVCVVCDLAALRVGHHHHHHVQLCGEMEVCYHTCYQAMLLDQFKLPFAGDEHGQ